MATIQDIENNRFSLSIPLYVKGSSIDETIKDERSLQEKYDAWEKASASLHESYSLLNEMLGKEDGNV